jgi:hypothetical protein
MSKETLKLALEALKWSVGCMSFDDYDDMPEAMAELEKAHKAIKALEEALAKQEHIKSLEEKTEDHDVDCLCADCDALDNYETKQEQGEPVAWIEHHKGGDNLNWEEVNHPYAKATPLYTTPQQRKPLTDAEIVSIAYDCDALPEVITDETLIIFARALWVIYGIKE